MNARGHWENVYRDRPPDAFSWYRPHLETSLDLIERAAAGRSASIIDVGGGESTLVDDLLARGYQHVTVLDISPTALKVTRARLGPLAEQVQWIAAGLLEADLTRHGYDVWHDRAVFHFLTSDNERVAYVRQALRAVRPGGHVIVGTFGPEGPQRCSGLDVVRYDAASLHDQFGRSFRLLESRQELHRTPFGTTQQFLYCYCVVE
ncbi:MAG TPA: class I SAM-dependent methyltransferase [Bryobacteraceae bacterium]|nr:class I SAM-dependent methyltransferase [Bryobacteraceae bacterium]